MKYVAVVTFYFNDDPHSLNMLDPVTAVMHIEKMLSMGFTVMSKPFDNYGIGLTWANKQFKKLESHD